MVLNLFEPIHLILGKSYWMGGQLPHEEEHGWLEHRPQLRYSSRPPPCRPEVEPNVFQR